MNIIYITASIVTLISVILFVFLSKEQKLIKIPALIYSLATIAYIFLCNELVFDVCNLFGVSINFANIFMTVLTVLLIIPPILLTLSVFILDNRFKKNSFIIFSFFDLFLTISLTIYLFVLNEDYKFLSAFLIVTFLLSLVLISMLITFDNKAMKISYFIFNGLFCIGCIVGTFSLLMSAYTSSVYNLALVIIIIITMMLAFVGIVCGYMRLNKKSKQMLIRKDGN